MDEEQIIGCMNRAFETVRQPIKDGITECDCWECMRIREDFAGRQPEQLDESTMHHHAWDIGFLTPEARQYYLPGWMRLSLRFPKAAYSDAVIAILGRDDGWDTLCGYTDAQKKSILGFLKLIRVRNKGSEDSDLEIALARWGNGV